MDRRDVKENVLGELSRRFLKECAGETIDRSEFEHRVINGGPMFRQEMKPADDCFLVLRGVGSWFERHLNRLGKGADWFWRSALEWMDEPGDPEYWLGQAALENQGKMYMPNHVTAIIACAVATTIEQENGNENVAWTYAISVRQLAADMIHLYEYGWQCDALFATRGANARHAENRALKMDAIKAYLAGNFASKDDAAEAIAGNVVPVKFRTVRDWLKGIPTP